MLASNNCRNSEALFDVLHTKVSGFGGTGFKAKEIVLSIWDILQCGLLPNWSDVDRHNFDDGVAAIEMAGP